VENEYTYFLRVCATEDCGEVIKETPSDLIKIGISKNPKGRLNWLSGFSPPTVKYYFVGGFIPLGRPIEAILHKRFFKKSFHTMYKKTLFWVSTEGMRCYVDVILPHMSEWFILDDAMGNTLLREYKIDVDRRVPMSPKKYAKELGLLDIEFYRRKLSRACE
jgi:hypothetical protein